MREARSSAAGRAAPACDLFSLPGAALLIAVAAFAQATYLHIKETAVQLFGRGGARLRRLSIPVRTAAPVSTMCAISPPGSCRTIRRRAAIDAGIATGQTKIINLPHKIAVAWVYLTGWVTRDGTVEFREDIYKYDDQLDRAALDDVAAGGFVAPVSQTLPQTASQPRPSMPRRGPPPAVTQASNPDR